MNMLYQFPYEEIKKGENIILYGAGNVGQSFLEQIKANSYCNIVAIADKNFENINAINGVQVISPNDISKYEYDKIIVSVKEYKDEMVNFLYTMGGIQERDIVSKNFKIFYTSEIVDPAEVHVIKTVFDILDISKPSYIDAGACLPHLSSNTMFFYKNGSRGINIEANIDLKEEFEKYRPEDINLFVGLAEKPGKMTFYKSNSPYLNTFRKDVIKHHEDHFNAEFSSEVTVTVTTLNDIVNEYANGEFPDFLDIDIEGMDEIVLRNVDFSKSSPKLICTEGWMPHFNKFLMNKKCEGDGYMPYCRIASNSIYLRKDVYKKVVSI